MALGNNGLIRTDTGRNDIEFVDTLAYNSSYNILKRTGTGRSDIAWESINTGSDTSGVTAGTSDVLDGKYFVNSSGSRLEGTMPNRGNGPVASTSRVVGNNNVYFRMNPGRYTSSYSGSIYNDTSEADKPEVYATYAQVASLVGLTAGKLLQGQTVLGIAGTGTGDGTAAAADILSGKTAYVDGSKITGSMSNQGAKTASLNCGGSYTIPKGYHNGSGKVTANSLSSQTSANATAADIVSGKTAWVNGSKITGTLKHYVAYTKNLCSNKNVSMSISPSSSNVSTHTKVTIGTIDISSISYFSNAYAILVKANKSGIGTKCSIILPGPKLMSDVITDSFDRLMAGAGEFGALTTGASLALIDKLDVYICAKLNSNSNPTGITLSAFAYLAGYNSKISGSFNLDANVVGFII